MTSYKYLVIPKKDLIKPLKINIKKEKNGKYPTLKELEKTLKRGIMLWE